LTTRVSLVTWGTFSFPTSAPGYLGERSRLKVTQLNPVEGVWSHLKGGVLANRGDDTVEELIELATGGVHKARSQQLLLFGFLGQTGLTL
jgi:hypothetical protein